MLHFCILTLKDKKQKLRKQFHLLSHQKNKKQKTKPKKTLGINLPKKAKDLYSENHKMLMKEIKDDTNKWKNTPCSWIGRINIVKMTILPEGNLHIQCNPYQITNVIFHRTRTRNFKIFMETQRP